MAMFNSHIKLPEGILLMRLNHYSKNRYLSSQNEGIERTLIIQKTDAINECFWGHLDQPSIFRIYIYNI